MKSSKANLSDVKQHEYLNRVADLRKKNLHCRLLNGRMKTQLREQRDFINDKNKEIEELKKQLATSNRQYS